MNQKNRGHTSMTTQVKVKRVINTDLVNLLLDKGYTLKYIDKSRDRRTGAIKLYFFFEQSTQLQSEIDAFMLELEASRKNKID